MINKNYITVNSKETVEKLVNYIQEYEILAFDTESTGLNVRKVKVVGWSVSGKEGDGFYFPTLVWNKDKEVLESPVIEGKLAEDISKQVLKLLIGKKLVLHNASFDCRLVKNYYGIDLIPYIYVDTGLLVHTLNEEGAFGFGNPFALKSIAKMHQKELGLNIEEEANKEQIELKKSIKENGGETTSFNYEIYKADVEILSKYGAADTDLTLRICNLYLKKLKEQELEKFFFEDEVMPIYREVTIPMEEYGVDLDIPLLEKTKKEINQDLEENRKIVIDSLMKLPEVKNWVIMQAFRFFPPSAKGNWAQELVKKYNIPVPVSEKTGKYMLSKKFILELPESKYRNFLLTGNVEYLDEMDTAKISMGMWKEANGGEYINIQSKKHLSEIVFGCLGIKSKSKTDKGNEQFDVKIVEHLAKDHEWAENLRVYNKLLKIKSAYVDRFLDNNENGRYYFYFKQNGTISGRYGSDAQQLPKPKEEGDDVPIILHYNNLVRSFFIAGPGRKVIDADYQSLEPHCFASVTGDENLREIFRKGYDFYSTVAIKTEKLDKDKRNYPNGVSPDPASPVFLKKIDPTKRNRAKAYSLGVAYGMGGYALGQFLGIPTKEGEFLVEGYLNGFPGLRRWREESREFAKKNGYIKNYVGRVRHLEKLKFLHEQFGEKLMDFNFRRELGRQLGSPTTANGFYREYRNSLNNSLNFQLQSLAASVVNRAALQINRRAKKMGINAQVQCQVHDQLIVNCEESRAEEFAPIVQDIMENTTKLPGIELKAPPEIGNNWLETH